MKRYEDDLLERLKNPAYAAAYLDAVLEEEDPSAFLIALRDVARAKGMSQLSQETELGRESLYKALSETGNPGIRTIDKVLHAMGMRLSVTPSQGVS